MSDQDFDDEVSKLFREAVTRALADEETKASLEELERGGLDVSVEKIRAELIASPDLVLGRVKTMESGWQAARERAAEARHELFEQIREGLKSWLFLVCAAAAAVAIAFGPAFVQWFPLLLLLVPFVQPGLTMVSRQGQIIARMEARKEARERFVAALEMQATAAVREAANRLLACFSTSFRIFDRRGLRQLADPDREVPTRAVEELEGLIASLDSGSIGLSGPRGCGKTTLIRSFTEGRSMPFSRELVGLVVAAPVKYDAREFVLHLFASLCERVLRDDGKNLPGVSVQSSQSNRRWARRLLLVAVPLLLVGAWLGFEPTAPSREVSGGVLLGLGCLAAVGAWLFWFETTSIGRATDAWLSRYLVFVEAEVRSHTAEATARHYLKRIRYQQSHEVGGSMELTMPFGAGGVGGSSSTTTSRAPWSLPDAVEEFRRFAETLSDRYVVIGIDELDKMQSEDDAREFLNNVKGVFGVPGCFFLVSVSEDAMSAFERRGLPLRDVFDSSFDEIQRVGYLDLAQSRALLESRVTGLPIPFQCLCHCLAGGLPRDLIRVTRELVHHYDLACAEIEAKAGDEDGAATRKGDAAAVEVSLATLTERLVEVEWRGKLVGAVAAGRSREEHPWWLTRWLHEQSDGRLGSEALKGWVAGIGTAPGLMAASNGDKNRAAPRRVAIETLVFDYYAATLLELFGKADVEGLLTSDGKTLAPCGDWVETLAMARQRFADDPWLSWGLVEAARRATGLVPWDDLRLSLEGSGTTAAQGEPSGA